MNKLKNKVFITIYLILTISLIIILLINNSTNYISERNRIVDNLTRMEMTPNNENIPPQDIKEDKERFMDINIYTIVLNNNKIDTIISHTKDETVPKEIKEKANTIIKNNNNRLYICNLYLNKYSYNYQDNTITIIDNTDINKRLSNHLIISLIIFILFEIIFYIISNIISNWIIKPVEESFKKQKQFVSDASHELKTPLSVIIASYEAYEKDNNKKWLNNIKTESERMNNLIKDLLDLARIDNNKEVYENNNISKLSEMTILPFESLIFENKLELTYNIEKDIYLKCNSNEIKQLISILMDNAIKHSNKESTVTFNLKEEKSSIIMEVINIGDEIEKGEEEKIFERFYRIDKSRNRDNNRYGLGLSIAKSITEKHNGTIKAKSNNNKTTFTVVFKK